MIVSHSANTVAFECLLVGCGRYSVFNKNRISDEILGRFERNWCVQRFANTQRKSHVLLMKF